MKHPFLSVCIPNYNRAASLGETLNSILSQTYQDYEIVVVDNHSEDNMEEVIGTFQDQRIRFVRNEWNIGAAKNLNRCVLESRGNYIKILNSGDVFTGTDALEKMVEATRNYPDAAIIACGYRHPDGSTPFSLPFDLLRRKGFSTVREVMNIHMFGLPSVWMIKKDTFPYTGLFIDSPICHADLVMKMAYYFDLYAISEPLVEHRGEAGGGSSSMGETMNRWEFMRFRVLEQLPFYSRLSSEQKAVLSSFLQIKLMSRIRTFIIGEAYHHALQSALDILKADPHLPFFYGEDREKVLELLLDQLVHRRKPNEIIDFMGTQQFSRPYADLFQYGFGLNYQLYRLDQKLKETSKKIAVVGTGYLTKVILQCFPELKNRIASIVDTGTDLQLLEGIPVTKDATLNFHDTFVIIASDDYVRFHRYELIRNGLIEGEHFLPALEDL
ncbi:glycosyltransferase family 2 protein [Effusibacillus consociatus]|uniref:Glycosyltransferase family 2 protein n=1 Tax=Effusibacillus consociatus TaxID=1117041 RepID=A0ABV9Q0N0_9BACL